MDLIGALASINKVVEAGIPWDISGATYNGSPINSVGLSAQDANPEGIFFKPDGTKMYVAGNDGNDINEYNLSTAWDITNITFVQSFSVAGQDSSPEGVFFRSDGLKMYVVGDQNDSVYEYTLSSAWDISTASYVQSFSVSTQDTSPVDLFFKTDGTKMYIVGGANDNVYEYDLSTAWDISTASYLQSVSVSTGAITVPRGLFFKSDGTEMYVAEEQRNKINQYSLSTPWDISTATFLQDFDVTGQDGDPSGVFFKSDGLKMFVVGSQNAGVYQYTLSTAWDISAATFTYPTTNYFVAGVNAYGLFFKPDGTRMYMTNTTSDRVDEFSLSTAWDITTASYVQIFSVSAQDANPRGLFFKPDGTKMYVVGGTGDDVNEYSLSSAWDISTASFVQNFSVNAQESNPTSLFFKSDGTKMYIGGQTGDEINEYDLSTAWDISTASFLQNKTGLGNLIAIYIRSDGLKIYTTDLGLQVKEYDLSVAWDVSTMSFVAISDVKDNAIIQYGPVFFKDDGTVFYTSGSNTSIVSVDLV